MATIHLGDPWGVDLETNVDLTTANTYEIKVKKPLSGKILTLTASINDTVMSANISASQNDECGWWKFHAVADFGDGDVHGFVARQQVKKLWGNAP